MSVNEVTCIVIPAYQAEHSIGPLLKEINLYGIQVIVVDDASTDHTAAEAEKAGAFVVRRAKNGGKGAALRNGFSIALLKNFEWVLTMDADGQHLASEIPLFLAAASNADMVMGDRMTNPVGMPKDRQMTNRWMSSLLSKMIGQKIPDSQCGFRMISHRVLETITLVCDHYEIESEMLVKAARSGFKISSVPITSVYQGSRSFIKPVRDTMRFFSFVRSIQKKDSKK